MTQLEMAKLNKISPEARYIAKEEKISPDLLIKRVKEGSAVIIKNNRRKIKPCGVGKGLRVKVNANLGTSLDKININGELRKLRAALDGGTDAVMDLSTGGNLKKIRKMILRNSPVPLGTVPIYDAVVNTVKRKEHISRMTKNDILDALEEQAADGVDFFTIHCGITQDVLTSLRRQKRLIPIVSRGGSFLAEWMTLNKSENPMYEYFDEILDIAKKYDITLSLGDGMRPGTLLDATDRPQIHELMVLGELAERARANNVQVIIEGPGHVPINEIETNMILQKKMCGNAPFYVLGPLVTDVAPGYDHIVGAIGGAIAALYGADFLCYLTPSEHLRIPDEKDVKEGVIASRIAAHAADIARGIPGALDWDREMSSYRVRRNWKKQIEKAIDPVKAAQYRKNSLSQKGNVCTMCGDYCSMKKTERYFK
jgi:phosphomethylpyrimidine synthase